MVFNRFQLHICNLYQRLKHRVDQLCLPFASDQYTSLLLVNHLNPYSSKNISDKMVSHSYTTNNISDIFKTNENIDLGEIILIEGIAGIGKSALCQIIAYKWSCKQLIPSEKLVLLIFLQDPVAQKINSIEDLVHYYYKLENISIEYSEVSSGLIGTQGINITIILDGFDEMKDETSFFQRLLCKEILPLCRIVVTSRLMKPNVSKLHKMAIINVQVKILGLTKEYREAFINNTLKDNPEKTAKIESYLCNHSTAARLCCIPFILSILVCIVKEYDELPKSLTEMYTKYIIHTISKALRSLNLLSSNTKHCQLSELPSQPKTLFLEICKYAYIALERNSLADKVEIATPALSSLHFSDAPSSRRGLGLLKSIESFSFDHENNNCTLYNFLHLSIQEYLAAYHITTLTMNKQFSILKKYFFNEKFLNMWIMYAGLCNNPLALMHLLSGTRFFGISKLFGVHKISTTILNSRIKCIYLLQCLPELQDSNCCNHIINSLCEGNELNFSGQALSDRDIDILTSILDKPAATQLKELNLSHCNIGDAGCNQLCNYLETVNYQINIEKINLSSNQLTNDSLNSIAKFIINSQTKRLNLSDNFYILNTAALHIATEFAFKGKSNDLLVNIQMNDQENIVLKDVEQHKIVSQLITGHCNTGIYLINCNISENVSRALKESLSMLSNLCIWDCFLHKDVTSHLLLTMADVNKSKYFCLHSKSSSINSMFIASIIFTNKTFSLMFILLNNISLIMHRVNDIHIKYTILSSPILPETSKLKEIQMFKCTIAAETTPSLLKLFKRCSKILKFILFGNNFEHKFLKGAISAIKKHPLLKDICIQDNHLTYDYCYTAADELSYDHTRFVMIFYRNGLRIFRSYDEQMNSMIQATIFQLQTYKPIIYERDDLSSNTRVNLYERRSIAHICLHQSKHLVLGKIDVSLPIHMTKILQLLDLSNLTVIQFTHCYVNHKVDFLFQRFAECEQLITFWYSDNYLKMDSKTFVKYLCDLIALPHLRKIYIYELCLTNDDLDSVKYQLCNYPKLKAIIINNNSVVGSNYDIKQHKNFKVPKSKSINFLWLQYCKINTFVLKELISFSYINEIEIKYSLMYDDIQLLDCNHLPRVSVIKLRHNEMTRCALKIIISIIRNCSSLRKLYLINNHIQLGMTEVDGKFKYTSQSSLSQLSSESSISFYNDVDLASDLATAISTKHHLQELYLNERYLISTIAIVSRGLTNISKLKILNLNGNINNSNNKILPTQIANIIKNNHSLQKLYLKDMNLKVKGITKIAKSLCYSSSIKVLDFQNNGLTEEAAEALESIMSKNIGVRELYLGNNHLQEGVIKISRALKKDSSLEALDLENNKISQKVVRELATAISTSTSLKRLWLDNNNNLGSSIATIIEACSKNSSLEQLCIANTGISEEVGQDVGAIIKRIPTILHLSISNNKLQSQGFISICHALAYKSNLKYFYAYGINITSDVTTALKSVIDSNTSLEQISLGNNFLEKGLIQIALSCSNLTNLNFLDLSNNCIDPQYIISLASIINKNYYLDSLSLGGITLNVYENLYLNVEAFHKNICKSFKVLALKRQNIIEFISCEILRMMTIRDFLLNYDSMHLSYVSEYVYVSHQYKDIFYKDFETSSECESLVEETHEKLLQINSKSMILILDNIQILKAINLECNNIDKGAATQLASHLQSTNILQQLWLRGNQLYDKGASVILKSLRNLSTLLILDLSYNHLSSKSADGIAVVIGNNCSLQQLWLDGNNLLSKGVVIIASALQKLSSLRILSLCSNGITEDAAEEIANLITCNILLVDLCLSNNQLQANGICTIADSLTNVLMLRKLNLCNNHATKDAAKDIADTISYCTNLQQLFLSDNMLGTEGTIEIANKLKHNNSLQVISLNNNNINESAAEVLVDVLKNNIHLKIILVGGNNLQTNGINLIIQEAKNITTLQLLDVSDNNVGQNMKEKFKTIFKNNDNITVLM